MRATSASSPPTTAIFERVGLEWYRVESDVGMMGGIGAHEYMAPCAAGEDEVALAPGYAANVEIASAQAQPVELPPPLPEPELVETPGMTTVAAVASEFGVPAGALLKAYPVIADDALKLVMLRGDHRVNDTKLRNALKAEFRPAQPAEFEDRIGPAGFIGPVGTDVPILLDEGGRVRAATSRVPNRPDSHLRGVEPGRDFAFERVDIRRVEAGDLVDGQPIRIEPAIEVGNIFKLGTRYSEPLGATYLDESGDEQPIWMGSYGIGPARIAAAAVEQFADEHGIAGRARSRRSTSSWSGSARRARRSARSPSGSTTSCARPGSTSSTTTATSARASKFADAELLGVPAAAHGRPAHARGRRDRGPGAARPRAAERAA